MATLKVMQDYLDNELLGIERQIVNLFDIRLTAVVDDRYSHLHPEDEVVGTVVGNCRGKVYETTYCVWRSNFNCCVRVRRCVTDICFQILKDANKRRKAVVGCSY